MHLHLKLFEKFRDFFRTGHMLVLEQLINLILIHSREIVPGSITESKGIGLHTFRPTLNSSTSHRCRRLELS